MYPNIPCDYCANPNSAVLDTEGRSYCQRCFAAMDTCGACIHGAKCEFETNPSPLPKQVQKTIRQGNAVLQTFVKNPDRIRELCLYACPCFDEENGCGKEFGYCPNYKEVSPRPKEEEVENDETGCNT